MCLLNGSKIRALEAKKVGFEISLYSSPDKFNEEINYYNSDAVIYIDSALNNGIKGEIFAKELYEKGFREIYLATGYSANQFNNMPWIKGIVGKEPPFSRCATNQDKQ